MNYCQFRNETIKRMANAGGATPILPSEYQQVEYIQTVSGGATIFSGVTTVTDNAQFELEMMLFSLPANGKLMEARNQSSGGLYLGLYNGIYYQLGTQGSGVYLTTTLTANEKFKFKADKGAMYRYDYVTNTYSSVGSFSPTSISITKTPAIFGGNYGNSPADNFVTGLLYSFKYWDDGTPISDLIPCYRIVDNVTGLYNLIDNTFITARTGSFTVGNNV